VDFEHKSKEESEKMIGSGNIRKKKPPPKPGMEEL